MGKKFWLQAQRNRLIKGIQRGEYLENFSRCGITVFEYIVDLDRQIAAAPDYDPQHYMHLLEPDDGPYFGGISHHTSIKENDNA